MTEMVYGPDRLPIPVSLPARNPKHPLPILPVYSQSTTVNTPTGLPMPTINTTDDDAKLRQAAKQFEAIFVHQMLEQMDKTIDRSNSMLNGGYAEDTFRGMMNQEIATQISNRPGGSHFGFAEAVYRQLSQQMSPNTSKGKADVPQN